MTDTTNTPINVEELAKDPEYLEMMLQLGASEETKKNQGKIQEKKAEGARLIELRNELAEQADVIADHEEIKRSDI